MSRTSPKDAAVRRTADNQAGLITSAQLAEIGLRTSTASRRCIGGMWTRVLPGVHLVDGGFPSRHQRERAALLYAGEPALLTGMTGLRHHAIRAVRLQEVADDVPERPEPVHALVNHDVRRLSTGYVRIERTRRFPQEAVRRDGLLIAPLARCVGDAVRRSRNSSDVDAVVAEVVQRGLVTVAELQEELDGGSQRGSALFRDALAAVATGAMSGPEADLARLLEPEGWPSVMYNVAVMTSSGSYVATPDVWLDDVGLAVEVDSVAYHSTPEGYAKTLRRNARYAAAGIPFVTVLPADLRARPRRIMGDIGQARSAAAARGRPDVVVQRQGSPSAGRRGWRWGA